MTDDLKPGLSPEDCAVLAGCRVLRPVLFSLGLDHRPNDGPATRRIRFETVQQVRAILNAARAEGPAQPDPRCAHCVNTDGPYPQARDSQRFWLARKLMDSKMTDAEVFSVVAYHPDIMDARPQPDTKALVRVAREAVNLARALRGAKLDDEAPARIALGDGTIVTGEIAEAFEAVGDAVIELGDLARQALASINSHQGEK